jgi:hypothetical protein
MSCSRKRSGRKLESQEANMNKLLIILLTVLLTFGIASFCYANPGEDGTPAMGEGNASAQEITPQALVTGKCNTNKVNFAVTDNAPFSTTSTTFVDMPEMSVTFTIPVGTPRSCVRVEFSAYTYAPGTELMDIRTVLDGTTVGAPGEIQFEGSSATWATSRAFNFLFTDVKAGTHTIKMQWYSFFGGDVFVHKRSMFVHHK